MADVAVIDTKELSVTPSFKYIEIEDVPQSEIQRRPVKKVVEVVEVRLAASKNYVPVLPVRAMYKREGLNIITYAERWKDQYAAFKQGRTQEAAGTPLEMLSDYGVSPSQISLCRALNIYSIELLDDLTGQGVKALGMHANTLKDAARRFMADRGTNKATLDELEQLRRRVAELEADVGASPDKPDTPAAEKKRETERQAVIEAADQPGFEVMTEE